MSVRPCRLWGLTLSRPDPSAKELPQAQELGSAPGGWTWHERGPAPGSIGRCEVALTKPALPHAPGSQPLLPEARSDPPWGHPGPTSSSPLLAPHRPRQLAVSFLANGQPWPGLPSCGGCPPPTPLAPHSGSSLGPQRLSPDSALRSLTHPLRVLLQQTSVEHPQVPGSVWALGPHL